MKYKYLRRLYEKPLFYVSFTAVEFYDLKPLFNNFIYLYVILICSGPLCAQNLHLEISSEQVLRASFLDSLDHQNSFENYLGLQSEVDSLLHKFQKIGYVDATLHQLNKSNDSTYHANYHLGNQWKEMVLLFKQEDFYESELSPFPYKKTDTSLTVPMELLEATLFQLSDNKANSGTPFASIQLVTINKINARQLSAHIQFEAGTQRTIDGYVIKGYEKFPETFLKYYAGVKKGKVFNKKKLIAQNDLLNNLGFVNTLKPPEALFKQDSTLIYFYLDKTNNNSFDGILGFATNEETQKLEFNGFLSLELNNNLNYGEQLKIHYKSDGREQQNFDVYTKMPYLFKTPFGLSLELKIFKRDSTFSTTEQQARIHYQASPRTSFYVGYKRYESSNLLDEPIAGSSVEDFDSKFLLVGAQYSRPQKSPLFPIKTQINLESEFGSRKRPDNKEAQIRLSARLSHSFNLNENNSIYIGNETGYFQSDDYLTNELYRFGGVNNLRGFNENSIDASLYSVVNTEYRYMFNRSIYVNSIFDLAYFENEIFNTQEELYSVGFGFGMSTRSGILRLALANGFSKEQNLNWSNVKIHFILSTSF